MDTENLLEAVNDAVPECRFAADVVNATLRTKSRVSRRRCRAKEMMTESI